MLRYLRYFMPDDIDEKGKFWYGVGYDKDKKFYSFSEWLFSLRKRTYCHDDMIVDKLLFKLWKDKTFVIAYNVCGYFSPYPEINVSMFGYHFCFVIPFRNNWTNECDEPRYGISIHDDIFWVYFGGVNKSWAWELPFFTLEHMRHDVECNIDGKIKMVSAKSLKSTGKEYIPLKDNKLVNIHKYDYTDSYDGSVIPCTYWVEEREWRPKWLTWTSIFKKVKKYIEIEFSDEVGKKKGSWKGGCIGCSYDLLENETPEQCIKRMEKERKF